MALSRYARRKEEKNTLANLAPPEQSSRYARRKENKVSSPLKSNSTDVINPTPLKDLPTAGQGKTLNEGQVKMTNDGLVGDVQGTRNRIQKSRALLNPNGSYRSDGTYNTNGISAKFDSGLDQNNVLAFLKAPTGGGRGPRMGFDPGRSSYGPKVLAQIPKPNELPSKEGLNRHQYQQLLENKGAMDVQEARNLGLRDTQNLQNAGDLERQGLRNQGALAEQELVNQRALGKQSLTQNKTRLSEEQKRKKQNVDRLKALNTLYQDRLKNFTGQDGDYETLQAEASKAAQEYERALGTGTTGKANDQAKKYLQ